jgi:hypothetical protein
MPRAATVLVAAALAVGGCADAPRPDDAAQRLALLEALPLDEIRVPGGSLLSTSSDPGAPGDGFLTDAQDVSLSRSYRFEGAAASACADVEEQLVDQGWDIRTSCRSDSQGFHTIVVGFEVTCDGVPLRGRFTFAERLLDRAEDANAYQSVRTPYPGTGAGMRQPSRPEGDALAMCDDDEPHR